jgi:hypothetical protein
VGLAEDAEQALDKAMAEEIHTSVEKVSSVATSK